MTVVNKITKIYPEGGATLTEEQIQVHIDEQNALGYYMVGVDNIGGWYRFFWAKVTE